MPSPLLADRWRSTVRAPVRAADRAARLIGVQPTLGPAYTVSGAVVACYARLWQAACRRADRKLRKAWLP